MMLDSEGLHTDRPTTISTYSRRRLNPLDLQPEDVDLQDIAQALSRQCRYNGHTGGHLSVARHSLWVSFELAKTPELQLWGLLHDATEAYLGDMVMPLKLAPDMRPFREAEARAEEAIAKAFGLPHPMPAEVHEADRFVTVELEIGRELRWLWNSTPEDDKAAFLTFYDMLVKS